jgi:CRISPR-associated protein Csb1
MEAEVAMDIGKLNEMIQRDAALRRRQKLQPVGGKGDKIFPPTYPPSDAMKRLLGERNAPPRHVFERRRIDGKEVWCVLVDSVQSQANRLEECLLDVIREERDGSERKIHIPHVVVDFTGRDLAGVTTITSLDAPHRVYDAVLRDSALPDGTAFMNSKIGLRLAKASIHDASALAEVSPTALLFGAWHSTGQGGGLGAKFARCLVSELVAIDVPAEEIFDRRTGERLEVQTSGRRTGSRIDPAGILSSVPIYRSAENENEWTPFEGEAAKGADGKAVLFARRKGDKAGRPSVINHGNVTPTVQPLGVTCDCIEHSFVLSFAALRRLRFGGDGKRDVPGRALLAALGLLAVVEQDARGYALRSRCDLVCEGVTPLQVVHADGQTDTAELDRKAVRDLYLAAFDQAREAGFALGDKPLELKPQDKLVEIVRKSQERALRGEGGEDEGAEGDGAGA